MHRRLLTGLAILALAAGLAACARQQTGLWHNISQGAGHIVHQQEGNLP